MDISSDVSTTVLTVNDVIVQGCFLSFHKTTLVFPSDISILSSHSHTHITNSKVKNDQTRQKTFYAYRDFTGITIVDFVRSITVKKKQCFSGFYREKSVYRKIYEFVDRFHTKNDSKSHLFQSRRAGRGHVQCPKEFRRNTTVQRKKKPVGKTSVSWVTIRNHYPVKRWRSFVYMSNVQSVGFRTRCVRVYIGMGAVGLGSVSGVHRRWYRWTGQKPVRRNGKARGAIPQRPGRVPGRWR